MHDKVPYWWFNYVTFKAYPERPKPVKNDHAELLAYAEFWKNAGLHLGGKALDV